MAKIGRVETRNLTRRGATRRRDFNEDDATVPVAIGMWVYSAVARCLANEAGRSLDSTRFDAAGRESLVIIASATVGVPTGGTRLPHPSGSVRFGTAPI